MRTILFVVFCALTAVVENANPNGGRCTTSADCDPSYICVSRNGNGNNNKKFCELVDCGTPTTANGQYCLTDDGTGLNDNATLTCNPGYKLSDGDATIECLETGEWSDGAECIESTCGGVINADGPGIFVSPNFPSDYDNIIDCTWTIVVPEGNLVNLTFYFLDIEAQESCIYDFLEVYDGLSGCDSLFGRYCGNDLPTIRSTSNELTVRFYTDSTVTRYGFFAVYRIESS